MTYKLSLKRKCLARKELTAVLFIGHISTVIPSITDPVFANTKTRVSAGELVVTTCCTVTLKTIVIYDLI